MKKPSLIIGKKQIIMTCLTLMLGIAVYINYVTTPVSLKDKTGVKTEKMTEDNTNYGETDEMVTNALAAVEVSKLIECEGNIESLIKAQGFADCVAYLDGESAKIVVKTEGLDKAQAASIKEVILGETEVPAENIRIFEVK